MRAAVPRRTKPPSPREVARRSRDGEGPPGAISQKIGGNMMNRTNNYNLCQWEETDRVQRTDFNEDNAKIDAAVKAVDRRVDGL